jgi:hypothetical protein
MPLRLHGFADFANYQLPEIGLCQPWRAAAARDRNIPRAPDFLRSRQFHLSDSDA